jgi:hypothetical protein
MKRRGASDIGEALTQEPVEHATPSIVLRPFSPFSKKRLYTCSGMFTLQRSKRTEHLEKHVRSKVYIHCVALRGGSKGYERFKDHTLPFQICFKLMVFFSKDLSVSEEKQDFIVSHET